MRVDAALAVAGTVGCAVWGAAGARVAGANKGATDTPRVSKVICLTCETWKAFNTLTILSHPTVVRDRSGPMALGAIGQESFLFWCHLHSQEPWGATRSAAQGWRIGDPE